MSEQGYILDIDTQFLNRLKKADEELKKIIGSVDNVTGAFKNMLNTAGGLNNNIFSNIIDQVEKLGKTKITANVDTVQLEKMMSTLSEISAIMGTMSSGGKELFDLKGIANMNASLVETENQLKAVEKNISDLKKKWNDAGFEEPINPRTGKAYGRNTETYKKAKKEHMSSDKAKLARADVDAELRAEIEKKAILERTLKFAKMTKDEQAAYIQKKVAEILNAEKKTAESIQKEYMDTVSKMVTVGGQYDKASKKNSGGAMDGQLLNYSIRFEELNNKRMEMERTYGEYVVNVAKEASAKISSLEIKRILDKQEAERKAAQEAAQTPQGALASASSASTISEMRTAMANLQAARDNVNVNDRKTIDELNEAYMRLRATVETLTTAEKNENSLQPSIRNEYERLHKELDKIVEAKNRLNSSNLGQNDATLGIANGAGADLEARERDLQARIAEIKKAAGNELDATDRKIAADRAAREIELAIQTEAQKKAEIIKQYQEALKTKDELDKIHNKMTKESMATGGDKPSIADQNEIARQRSEVAKKIEDIEQNHSEAIKGIVDKRNRDRIKAELDARKNQVNLTRQTQDQIKNIVAKAQKGGAWDTFKDSINPFKRGKMVDTKSIEEAVAAIDRLKAARDRLNKENMSDSNGRYQRGINRINEEIKKQEAYIERLRGAHRRLAQDAEKLKSILGRVFGLAALKGYASQLIRVRGEFEMAQRSLEVLLKNKGEADLLWRKTVDLAVKSPYTTQQLITATKQLAAYRVESHKLYSTTKLLTDISSGLGVEINRLVLAYGQVKAANFLRGTELRQFSEAGVNMLDALAERFSKLEGRVVSVSEVFDMISKRKVKFADVEAVLKEMTSEGGMFFEMQEKQSETLRGQLLNLKDSIELMFNDMGKAADGTIKNIIGLLKWMVDNWREIGAAIGPVVGAFALFKGSTIIVNGLVASINALKLAFNTNPITFWIGVVSAAIGLIVGFTNSAEKLRDIMASDMDVFVENTNIINSHAQAIINLTEKRNELLQTIEASKKAGIDSTELELELDKITKARTVSLSELADANRDYADSLRAAGDDVNKMKYAQAAEGKIQRSTSAFISGISNIDFEKLDESERKTAAAYGTMVRASIAANEDLNKQLDEYIIKKGNGHIMFTESLIESEGDIEKVFTIYEEKLRAYAGLTEEMIKSYLAAARNGEIGGFESKDLFKEALALFEEAQGSDEIKSQLEHILMQSFMPQEMEALKAAIENGEGTPEYGEAVETLKTLYYSIIKNAGDRLGAGGSKVVEEQMAKVFQLNQDWLSTSVEVPLEGWMIAYNAFIETLVDKNDGLYEVLAATEQDTVSKRISAINAEISERQVLINTLKLQLELESQAENGNLTDEQIANINSRIEQANAEIETAKKALKVLGGKARGSGRGGGNQEDKWVKAAKTIKDVSDAYDKLNEKFGKTIATKKLWDEYGEVVTNNLKDIGYTAERVRNEFGDLTTSDSLEKALKHISNYGSAKGKKLALEFIAEIELEYEIKNRDKQFRNLTQAVERLFAGYEISVEIGELNIPRSIASSFFDVDVRSIEDLRAAVMRLKTEFINAYGKEGEAEFQKYIDKIEELEAKSQQDRLKKYINFTKSIISERGKVLIDEYNKISEINESFKATNTMARNDGIITQEQYEMLVDAGKSISDMTESDLKSVLNLNDDQITKWKHFTEIMEQQKQLAIDKVRSDSLVETEKLGWDSFKESELFERVFNDLDNASNALIENALERLKEFKEVWAGMDMSEYSEVLDLISRLEDALSGGTPLRSYKEAKDALSKSLNGEEGYKIEFKYDRARAIAERASERKLESRSYDDYRLALEEELVYRNSIVTLKAKELADAELAYDIELKREGATKESIQQAGRVVAQKKKEYDFSVKSLGVVTDMIDTDNERRRELINVNNGLEESLECAQNLYDAFKGLAEVFADEDNLGLMFADAGMQMAQTVINTIMLQMQLKAATVAAGTFGAAMNTAMGVIGWIVMGIQLITMALTAAFKAHDKIIQKQMDAEIEDVETLKEKYEELEKQLENAYRSSEIGRLTREMNDNLQEQIDKTRELKALEEDKKKTDEDALVNYDKEIKDMEEQMSENIENAFSTLTDGILDNVLDAAKDFVDAWHDAYQEAGDGMKGLEESFKDMLLNMLKQQAAMQLVSPFIAKYKKWLEEYVNEYDTELTPEEARAWATRVKETLPEVNEQLTNYFEAINDLIQPSGELSGLEKGIQGMTEEQAEVLAAYWNSCRFMLSNIDTNLSAIATNILSGTNGQNPVVDAIKAQTEIVTDIRDIVRSVIREVGHPSDGGGYIKVLEG